MKFCTVYKAGMKTLQTIYLNRERWWKTKTRPLPYICCMTHYTYACDLSLHLSYMHNMFQLFHLFVGYSAMCTVLMGYSYSAMCTVLMGYSSQLAADKPVSSRAWGVTMHGVDQTKSHKQVQILCLKGPTQFSHLSKGTIDHVQPRPLTTPIDHLDCKF